MKLLNWLNEDESPEFLETKETDLAPALKHRLGELKSAPITQLMVPRPLIQGLDADVQLRRVKRLKSSKTRYFPVYKGDLDHILGWIEKAKVIELLNEGREDARLENQVQPIAKIPDTAMISDLADLFLKAKSPMAIVTTGQGLTAGLVTLPDFIELLFGFDVEGTSTSPGPNESPKNYEI